MGQVTNSEDSDDFLNIKMTFYNFKMGAIVIQRCRGKIDMEIVH